MAHTDVTSSVIGYTIDPIIDFLLLLAIPQGGQRSGSDTQMMMRAGSRDCDTGYSKMFDFDTNNTSYCLWEYKFINDNDIKNVKLLLLIDKGWYLKSNTIHHTSYKIK